MRSIEGQAWTHQPPHALHLSSSIIRTPPLSDCFRALRGQAFAHGASSQNLQVIVVLKNEFRGITLILDLRGFRRNPSFSKAQTYSQMPQPVHLLGLTEANCLGLCPLIPFGNFGNTSFPSSLLYPLNDFRLSSTQFGSPRLSYLHRSIGCST